MTFHRIGITATLVAALAIICSLGISGCGPMPLLTAGSQSTDILGAKTVQEAIQRAINEANVDITAAARVLNRNERAKIVSKSDAATLRQTLKEAADEVDLAQAILRQTDPDHEAAGTHLELAQTMILAIRKQIDRQTQQEKPK